jgi:hypothetical protein
MPAVWSLGTGGVRVWSLGTLLLTGTRLRATRKRRSERALWVTASYPHHGLEFEAVLVEYRCATRDYTVEFGFDSNN